MSHLHPQLDARIRYVVPSMAGWCPVEKALELARCICEQRPRICVEIGVFGGRSLLAQAIACESLQHGHVFGIDPWSEKESLENMTEPEQIAYWSQVDHEAIFRGCRQAVLDEGLTQFCSLIRTRSQDCADFLCNIDVLHIDGNHSRENAVRDVQLFLPKVRDGGHIWFDDANWNSTQDAVRLLREECEVVGDYGSYLHLRKYSRRPAMAPPAIELDGDAPRDSLQRRILTFPDNSLGSFRGGVYNPGAVAMGNNHLLLVARNERFTELDRQADRARCWGTCRPLAIMLDRSGDITSFTPLTLPPELQVERAEDFRLFLWRSELYAGFSRVRRSGRVEIQIAPVDLEQLELGPLLQPRVDFAVASVEKNWCFFERRENLYLVYSFQPFRLLKLVDPETFQFQTILADPIITYSQSHALRFAPKVSLSTPPIEFCGDLIFFVHRRNSEQCYEHYAVWLDSNTLRPMRMSRHPIFLGGDAQGLRPGVLYLMSVVRADGDYWFFFGEGDEYASFVHLSESQLSELLADTVEIGLDASHSDVVGEFAYEHHGIFRRTVFLRDDGCIENGGHHDSNWRIERFGERSELWILGSNGLSCRMDPTGHGDWSGIWNRDTRPRVTLTRVQAKAEGQDY